jgi:hypothetical protein
VAAGTDEHIAELYCDTRDESNIKRELVYKPEKSQTSSGSPKSL